MINGDIDGAIQFPTRIPVLSRERPDDRWVDLAVVEGIHNSLI
jgi:hypothetical protein